MKKDIPFYPVNKVNLAIAREKEDSGEYSWFVYMINKNDVTLHNILIVSKGYGEKAGEKQKTSILRHSIEALAPYSYAMIEPIAPSVFHLFNEFWISYYINKQVYDKKFLFAPGSTSEENISFISDIELEGVLHI